MDGGRRAVDEVRKVIQTGGEVERWKMSRDSEKELAPTRLDEGEREWAIVKRIMRRVPWMELVDTVMMG